MNRLIFEGDSLLPCGLAKRFVNESTEIAGPCGRRHNSLNSFRTI